MIFRTFFFFIIIAFSSLSHAQWWVSGGNAIWPYGNVSITKGNLNVVGSFNVTGQSTFLNDVYISDETYSPIQFLNIDEVPIFELNPNHTSVTLGDIDYQNAGTTIFVSDWQQLIRLYTADSLLIDCFGHLLIGDASNLQYGTLISVLDDYRKVNIDADSTNINGKLNISDDLKADGDVIKFENLPSDSTGLATGQIYYDSNGFIKKKF
ncbi:MAG: hypothetical protein PVF17_03665 [Ignavibacteria bacterium]